MPTVTSLNPLPEHVTAAWVGWFVHAFAAAGTVDVVLGEPGRPAAAAQFVHLESINPRNVPFSASLGFVRGDEVVLQPDGPPRWPMGWSAS